MKTSPNTPRKGKWVRKGIKKASKGLKLKSAHSEVSVSKLTKELDTLFSRVLRLSTAKDEICTCYTCGLQIHYKKIHAGHYISRYYKITRWDERNVKTQCLMCNIYRKGNSFIFRQNLVRDYGEETIKSMEESAKMLVRGTSFKEDLLKNIDIYKAKLKELSPTE